MELYVKDQKFADDVDLTSQTYTVVQKNWTPVKSSNSCTEYDPISVIFGLENRRRVFTLKASNW